VALEGVFAPRRFLDLMRHFIVFEDAGGGALVKKMAGYHQFHAVNVAVEETVRACAPAATQPLRWARSAAGTQAGTASRATGASAWSGTRRARARA
jgi:type I restriction enzyme R subunit